MNQFSYVHYIPFFFNLGEAQMDLLHCSGQQEPMDSFQSAKSPSAAFCQFSPSHLPHSQFLHIPIAQVNSFLPINTGKMNIIPKTSNVFIFSPFKNITVSNAKSQIRHLPHCPDFHTNTILHFINTYCEHAHTHLKTGFKC